MSHVNLPVLNFTTQVLAAITYGSLRHLLLALVFPSLSYSYPGFPPKPCRKLKLAISEAL